MKKLLTILALGFFAVLPARAEINLDFFYNSLEPHGDWIEAEDYGYVWHPRDVDEDWRPYTDGHWVYTDAGWTWESEEPYGWAVYHYGRWARLEGTGWVWVPDTEWGPAWVSWRRNKEHVGWAPLPPEARFQRTVGIQKWADSYYDIGPANYTFVETRNLGAPRIRQVVIEPRRNVTIVRETTNITNITYVNNVVYNEGPEYEVVVRETTQPIRRLRLERRTDVVYDEEPGRPDRYQNRVQGDTLQIVAPIIQVVATAVPRRVSRKVERVEVNRGWRDSGDAVDAGRVEELRTKIKAEAKPPAELPPQPKFDRKVVAREATEKAASAPVKAAAAVDKAKPLPTDKAAPEKMKEGEKPGAGTPAAATPQPKAATPPTTTTLPPAGESAKPATPAKATPPAATPAPPSAATPAPATPAPATPAKDRSARPGRNRPDPAKPAADKPEMTKPDAKKPEAVEPGVTPSVPEKPEAPKADPAKPEATEKPPKAAQPDSEAPTPGRVKKPGVAPTPGSTPTDPNAGTPDAPASPRERRAERNNARTLPAGDKPERTNRPGRAPAAEVEKPGAPPREDAPAAERPSSPSPSGVPGAQLRERHKPPIERPAAAVERSREPVPAARERGVPAEPRAGAPARTQPETAAPADAKGKSKGKDKESEAAEPLAPQ